MAQEGTAPPRERRAQAEAHGTAEAAPLAQGPLERLASFRFAYAAIFCFLVAYVFTVETLEAVLQDHFSEEIAAAIVLDADEGPAAAVIQERVGTLLAESRWIRPGEVRVRPLVLGADGLTLLYAPGRALPPAAAMPPDSTVLPAIADVEVSVPHNGLLANTILVGYAGLLVIVLASHTRRLTRRQKVELEAVVSARDSVAGRAEQIQTELEAVRGRLAQVEPEKEVYAEEIGSLEQERTGLLARLAEVESREEALRLRSEQARDLDEERRALEELLDDASRDLAQKDEEIAELRTQARSQPSKARRGARASRDVELLGRRLRTLYKDLEVDDHALEGLASLGDESLKLRAEETIKRLCEEPESAGVRRKLGGLPPHLAIFEMAFAGKGRLYTTRGQERRIRLLLVGAKNTQKKDLEYLSRLPKGT